VHFGWSDIIRGRTTVLFYPCSYTCGMITFFTLALTHVAWLPFLPLLLHMWHDYLLYPCSYTCGMITFFTLALTHVAWLPFLSLLLHMWHDYLFYPCSYTCGMITFFTLALTHVAWLPFLPLLLHMWHDYHISNFYKNDWLHFKYLNTYWSIIEEMKNLLRVINFLCTLILG
jgi:hypothetical protein